MEKKSLAIRLSEAQAAELRGDKVNYFDFVPVEWVDVLLFIFMTKPQIKSKMAIIAQLLIWKNKHKLTLDELRAMADHLTSPEGVIDDRYGVGAIITNMGSFLVDLRRREADKKETARIIEEHKEWIERQNTLSIGDSVQAVEEWHKLGVVLRAKPNAEEANRISGFWNGDSTGKKGDE